MKENSCLRFALFAWVSEEGEGSCLLTPTHPFGDSEPQKETLTPGAIS